jgi:hypothetical protein
MSHTGDELSEGFLSVGDWPPTISRWFGVEFVP